ncbi:hypothetical protein [Methylobacterium nigriterrae]|uniref:hypothetical protein n=1 Tax=Methylobacterium nigriterrae TaxID=3127512 RepID=UPI00301392BC
MHALVFPVALSAVFTGGCMAIHALNRRWADQVRDALQVLVVVAVLILAGAFAACNPPHDYANVPARPSASVVSISGGAVPFAVTVDESAD